MLFRSAAVDRSDCREERIGTLEATLEHKQSGREQSETAAAGTNGEDGSKSTGSFSPDLEASPNPTDRTSQSSPPGGNKSPSPVSAADQTAVDEGTVYAGNTCGILTGIRADSGDTEWELQVDGGRWSAWQP